jgi:ribosomal protein S18 acetylase RimI-like enzyme
MKFAIRVGTPEDKKILKTFVNQLVNDLGEDFDEKRFDWGILRRLYDPLQRHGIFLAENEETGEPAGMIVAELRVDPYGLSEGYIKLVFVSEPYRGKGVGEELFKEALNHLKKINVQKVKVNLKERATKAAKLYEKYKFKKKYEVLELKL